MKKNASNVSETKVSNIMNKDKLISHITEKKRKMDIYRRILELKYIRYKRCYDWSNIGIIFLSTSLTLVESFKLIFLGGETIETYDEMRKDFFDLTPIIISSIITFVSSVLKFQKYQEKMENFNNIIEKSITMISKLKTKKELLFTILKKPCECNDDNFEEILKTYNEEILIEYYLIYQLIQKQIKNSDYDKYCRILNLSDYHRYIVDEEKKLFYQKHRANIDIEYIEKKSKKCSKADSVCCAL